LSLFFKLFLPQALSSGLAYITADTALERGATRDQCYQASQVQQCLYPTPCKYEFGSTTLQHAINFAQVFTTITMGTLQEAVTTLARDGNTLQVRTIVAMIGNGAEPAGYFRHMLERKPSAQPFPTTSVAPFFPSALDTFTIPCSCPFPASSINIATFSPFNLVGIGMIKHKDQTISLETGLNGVASVTRYFNKDRWM
jgi:hypothetical protein